MNQWMEGYLQLFVKGCQNDWSSYLPIAEFTYNSWKHKHTKHSPHELIMGINPNTSFNVPKDPVSAMQDHFKELIKARQDTQITLQCCIKPLNVPCSFVLGDQIWLDTHNLKIKTLSRKLSPQRYSPYPILEQLLPVTYCIKLPPSLPIKNIFHMDLLTLFHETKKHGQNYLQPLPKVIDREEEFEVEEIINEHMHCQKKQYLIKWLRYPATNNS
jgi:hypothetical protein